MQTSKRNSTAANVGSGEGSENLRPLRSLMFKSWSVGDADFIFLARRTGLSRRSQTKAEVRPSRARWSGPSAINSQSSTTQQLREYKAVYVQSDAEIGLFSDEVVVNCAP